MSDSLTPWILPYLLESAETYGAQISTIPPFEKKKKVQIIEFLTFGSDAQDTYIWARVSDKQHTVPLKCSKDAVAEFSRMQNTRLTQQKGAIVTIKKFRPIFTRIPGLDGGKPSKGSYLALECDSVSLLGSAGESTFGNPKPINNHPDMHAWSEGLDHPGGAGNILKERKQESQVHDKATDVSSKQSLMLPPPPFAPHPQVSVAETRPLPLKTVAVTDLASYRARWQIVEKNTCYRHPPEQNDANSSLAMEVDVTEDSSTRPEIDSQSLLEVEAVESSTQPEINFQSFLEDPKVASPQATRSRSGTPLTSWETSPQVVKTDEIRHTNTTVSSLAPPTPAQRIKRPIATPDGTPSSSYPLGNETADIDMNISSSQVVSAVQGRPVVPRKVPRPTSPQPRHTTGPERVLVPNSDTSGTQSQSLTQSQSQSQSRPSEYEMQADASSSRNNAPQKDVAMDIDGVKKHRRSDISRAKSDPSSATSPRGERRTPEKRAGNRVQTKIPAVVVDDSSSSSDDVDIDNPLPWTMSLTQIRDVILRAETLRSGLHNIFT
ncbi:hypothetical protein HYPSUDRAFT_34960 [Hypholoma sublateritium FD-334 SS-4]|uniref:Shelterin complex subunit TPP1/Est3 domain-containing protein n=1 Tax=Hypholoma sublateritium (strain FD-334 SS-4) TaxID=945553 RepID=A0A0D2LJG2_HYPSF|nr:hypothetical protein HYPSUDRAFT_34960 [Hypholoma sublateritium FD-334 SS-4]